MEITLRNLSGYAPGFFSVFVAEVDAPYQELKPRQISGINRIGLYTFTRKEVSRFLTVYLQTIVAPAITTLLFYTIFSLAFGGMRREIDGVPYMEFLAPGLIMMSMVQNAFANSSSSLVIAKIQGNIVDVLMPPLNSAELLFGYIMGGIVRGLVIGTTTGIVMSFVVALTPHNIIAVIGFSLLGTTMLSAMGLIAGIWAEKFDHIAAVTNFFVTPMAFLSGTFYSIGSLPETWQTVALFNPFFYMIDGFRYGFTGHAEGSLIAGFICLLAVDIFLLCLAWWMLKTGYKIKS
jgi:ABC-2 type transport system permease protein